MSIKFWTKTIGQFIHYGLSHQSRNRAIKLPPRVFSSLNIPFDKQRHYSTETPSIKHLLACVGLLGFSILHKPVECQENSNENKLSEFKQKLKNISLYEKTPAEVSKSLFGIKPESIDLQLLVDVIFDEIDWPNDILLFLDAILFKYPSFILSEYNQIRREIVKDKKHQLSNAWLLSKFDNLENLIDEKQKTKCYDLAYRINHPFIYPSAQTPIRVNEYTLNFLWVNLNPQDRSKNESMNIFSEGLDPAENAECLTNTTTLHLCEIAEQTTFGIADFCGMQSIKKSFLYRISKWADANPEAQINVWYDSALVTQKAQLKTFEMVQALSKSRNVNLALMDIRSLPNIKGEIEHSLHPGAPLYYRVDLLKVLIADYMTDSGSKNTAKYCVISDIDVHPMSSGQIFDQRTLEYLTSNGYAFNRVGLFDFENSFFIFNKEKKDLHVHNRAILESISCNIREMRSYPLDTSFLSKYVMGSQYVFDRYSQFRREMNESADNPPRKVVKCPRSQFNFGGKFSTLDHQKETFRFIGDDNIPYTTCGRSFSQYKGREGQIEELKHWQAKPLDTPDRLV